MTKSAYYDNPPPACEKCGFQILGPGLVRGDLLAPPCKTCEAKSAKRFEKLGADLAMNCERAIVDAILK